ncbi:MAG: PKD domain-containing protein [Candidatus Thermoplasmatota archaeon]|nr:PKD domain-containing protein [Candidatus Thermoplasmatota archaeon]
MIITSENLYNSVLFLKNWKNFIGFSVEITNVSWIEKSFDGRDMPEKIKNYINHMHELYDIRYVLLVGDDTVIPWRYCTIVDNSEPVPSDFYYADLSSNWDSDNDDVFAEFVDDDWPDFTAEVYIGRIPFKDSKVIREICRQIILFEQDNSYWKDNILLAGAISNFENEQGSKDAATDNAYLMEKIKTDILDPNEFQSTTLYEKQGLQPSKLTCTTPLTKNSFNSILNNESFGLIAWGSHGSSYGSYRRWWSHDDDSDYIPDLNEIRCEYFITSDDANQLPFINSIIFSCSCNNIDPADDNNLGKTFLQNGVATFIGATKESRYPTGWKTEDDGGNMAITYYFFERVITNKKSVGAALYSSLTNSWENGSTPVFKNMLVFNLYGDPSISLKTFPKQNKPHTPTQPEGPDTIQPGEQIFLTTSMVTKKNTTVYYQWDFGDDTISDPIGPYTCNETVTISHTFSNPGDYKVKVKAINAFGDESEWSSSLVVHVIGPVITVEDVTGGLFKLNAFLQNSGDSHAENITWEITIHNSSMLLGQESHGSIRLLAPNEKVRIISDFILGLGQTSEIQIHTSIQNGGEDIIYITARVFLCHIFIKEEI